MSLQNIKNTWSQLYPPKPSFTEEYISDLAGKVFIVTGANTGIGKSVAQVLYSKNAKVYVAARSVEKAHSAIADIKARWPDSKGELVFLQLDLGDLSTIKESVSKFLTAESRLDVLFNNAGVMVPPQGSKTAQGYELQLGTNNIGTFMFTALLTPLLISTAKTAAKDTVRVIWVSSSAADVYSPKPIDVMMDNLDYHVEKSKQYKYGVSKAGNYLHAVEYQRRYGHEGVVSVALNPGNLSTELARHVSTAEKLALHLIHYPPINGAYTELFAGLSPEITADKLKTDNWIVPWGRFLPIRNDILAASRPKREGGTGVGERFWEWTEAQIKPYI